MKWFRKSFILASLGCLGLSTPVLAQQAPPRAFSLARHKPLTPAGTDASTVRVVTPAVFGEAHSAPPAIRQTSFTLLPPSVVRAARAETDEEPRSLYLPRSAELLLESSPASTGTESVGEGKKLAPRATVRKTETVATQPRPSLVSSFLKTVEFTPSPAPAPTPIGDRVFTDAAGNPITLPEGTIIYDAPAMPQWYFSAEYLLWTTKGFRLPPLVTTGPATGNEDTRASFADPNTQVLFGNSRTSNGPTSGVRFMAGWLIDPCSDCMIEGGYFFVGRKSDRFNVDSSQFPVLGRPFFNLAGFQDRQLVASPGTTPGDVFSLRGGITVDAFSELQGAELSAKHCIRSGCDFRLSSLVGFRYLDLDEGLTIREDIVSLRDVAGIPLLAPGTAIVVTDQFQTRNRFYGGTLGAQYVTQRGKWSLDTRARIGLGVTEQTINIAGSQVFTSPDGTVNRFNGGLLALPSNIGQHSQNRFSVVPEVGVKVGYQMTEHVRVFVGYDLLYWSSVVRPGDQIDLTLNAAQIPNFTPNPVFAPVGLAARPVVPFRTTDFFAHGFNAGLEVRY